MTITREQLELAAKAAGLDVVQALFYPCPQHENCTGDFRCLEIDTKDGFVFWNPHHDHGQLMELAMACEIGIGPKTGFIIYSVGEEVRERKVDCKDFPALAEAVITAAAEQQLAKENKE